MANIRVLIVDDEEDFRDILSQRMVARGFDVEAAESGAKAIEIVSRKTFDAIILDLAMPEMDGIETMQKLLAKDATLQIIMLTGHGTIQKGVEAVKMGAADFLEKPAEIDLLVTKIEEAQSKKLALFTEALDAKISGIAKKKGW